MINPARYFTTNNTKLSACLLSEGIRFLQVDEERSTGSEVYFVFPDIDRCREIETRFFSGELKIPARQLLDNFQLMMKEIHNYRRSV